MTAPVATAAPPPSAASGSLLSKLEIDVRMLGMLAALAVIWIGFDILSGGVFLTPVAITKDNLDVVINAGWASKDVVCQGVKAGSAKACN